MLFSTFLTVNIILLLSVKHSSTETMNLFNLSDFFGAIYLTPCSLYYRYFHSFHSGHWQCTDELD